MISSIPSTIVLPLQDNGTPAGPSLSGIGFAPAGRGERVSLLKAYSVVVRLGKQKLTGNIVGYLEINNALLLF